MLDHFADVETMAERLAPEVPVYCLRPELLAQMAGRFLAGFPGRVLYAVKANPLEPVLDALYAAGVRHFDTASIGEIALISQRLPEATAYFMHPVKGPDAIRRAYRDHGVRHFAVDHADEVDKMTLALGGAPSDLVMVVRMATPGDGAIFNLSEKFGAAPAQAAALLRSVVATGARPGLCFHVGSQCTAPRAFERALALAGEVLNAAGVAPCCLDVGGGFPTAYDEETVPELGAFFQAIAAGLARLALPTDCAIMCEPGRALVAEAMSLVAQVQHRRDRQLYINDGIYGSLHGSKLGVRYPVRLIRPAGPVPARESAAFTVFGPTCDSLDVLSAPVVLPADTRQGDWIEFDRVGAYGNALRTEFNGFRPETFVTVDAPFGGDRRIAPRRAASGIPA